MKEREKLEMNRLQVLEEFSQLGDLRRGSLVTRYIRCGKEGCHCHEAGESGHGPKHSLTYKEKGRTVTEYVDAEHLAQVKGQFSEHRRFLELCQQFLRINEQICRLRLQEKETEAKKNLHRKSTRRLAKKSKKS